MPSFKVMNIEERADGQLSIDTFVLVDKVDEAGESTQVQAGHFTVELRAEDVLALADLTKAKRMAGYKALFMADSRISGVIESEKATAQMMADLTLPLVVEI